MKTYKIYFKGVRHGKEQEEIHSWILTGDNEAITVASLRMWFKNVTIIKTKEIGQ